MHERAVVEASSSHVDVLELMVPFLWEAGIKTDEGEKAKDVLVENVVVAVDVVRHLHTRLQVLMLK